MRFRIGINVGDVMVKDGDLFGDGVNIAARLEGLRRLLYHGRAPPNARERCCRVRGSKGSNLFPSSGESANHRSY
jgi:hypothetical protein